MSVNYIATAGNIFLNNMNYESGRGGYMPNTASTTEGQAMVLRGYLRAYLAEGEAEFKQKALAIADAMLDHYFFGATIDTIPTSGVWASQWVINGGGTFYTKGPKHPTDPTFDGMIETNLSFVSGVGNIPNLAQIYNIHDGGKVSWWCTQANIVGGTYAQIDHYYDRYGMKFNAYGVVSGAPISVSQAGKVVLSGAYAAYTGVLLSNYSTYTTSGIEYGAPFECWPMWRILEPGEWNFAGDSIHWILDCFDLLKQVDTARAAKWQVAIDAMLRNWTAGTSFTGELYMSKRTGEIGKPFNSWPLTFFNYTATGGEQQDPSTDCSYYRDSKGFVVFELPYDTGRPFFSWANECLFFNFVRATDSLKFELGSSISTTAHVIISDENNVSSQVPMTIPAGTPTIRTIPLSSFLPCYSWKNMSAGFDGTDYRFSIPQVEEGLAESGAGFGGYWVTPPASITYFMPDLGRFGFPGFYTKWVYWLLRVSDVDGNKIIKVLDSYSGSGTWHTVTDIATGYPESGGWSIYDTPVTLTRPLTNIEFLVDDRYYMDAAGYTLVHPFVGAPAPSATGKIKKITLKVDSQASYNLKIGDCYLSGAGATRDPVKYTPGALAFQVSSKSATVAVGKATGAPFQGNFYMGYQSPVPYLFSGDFTAAQTMLTMLSDSQAAYTSILASHGFVIGGPFCPTYIQATWDAIIFGAQDTWGWAGPDPNTFWGGFQFRAFYNVSDYWQRGITQSIADASIAQAGAIAFQFMTWLDGWLTANPTAIYLPITFTATALPDNNYGDTHIIANAMAGAIFCKLAGADIPTCQRVVERLYFMLLQHQQKSTDMVGAFSPDPATYTFYGYWAGEIMNALSLLKMYYPTVFATWRP